MTIYSIDLKVAATAYVRADSQADAIQALKDEIGLNGCDYADIEISGVALDSPELPDISLSPAMTIYGPWGSWSEMEEV